MKANVKVIMAVVGEEIMATALYEKEEGIDAVDYKKKITRHNYNKHLFSKIGTEIGGNIFLKMIRTGYQIGEIVFFTITPIEQECLEAFISAFRKNLCFISYPIDKSLFKFVKKFERK